MALRDRIDTLDAQLIDLLARRFAVTREVGALKLREQLPPIDPAREATQTLRIRNLALLHGIAPALAEQVFRLVVDAVVEEHRSLRQDAEAGS